MRKVSGSLKLELAQYREIASFAQFGSDLDEATQKLLNRGSHLTELLKQPQYTPYTIERQIVSVYAGTSGFFDTLPLVQVLEIEKDLLNFVFGNIVLRPYIDLLREEFDDQIFSLVLSLYKKIRKL